MIYVWGYIVVAFLTFLWVCSERKRDDKMLNIQNRPLYWLIVGAILIGILWPFMAFTICYDYWDKRSMITRYD